jgi:predicted permease
VSAAPRPPRLARALLRLRPLRSCRPDVEADLDDVFAVRAAAKGVRHARRRFYMDVLSLMWRRLPGPPAAGPSHRLRLLVGWRDDFVLAARLFRKHPLLITTAVAGLGVGIGMSTSVFSVINALLLRPLGVADPAGSVKVMRAISTPLSAGVATGWPYATFVRLRERSATAAVEAYFGDGAAFGEGDPADARTVNVTFVSGSLLSTFGARALTGRLLAAADDLPGVPPVAVASYGFWRHALGGDRGVLGRQVRLSGATFTIIGVGERGFTGPMSAETPPAFWLPLGTYYAALGGLNFAPDSPAMVNVAAHVIRGASIPQAARELSAIAAGLPLVPGSLVAGGERTTGVRLDPVDDRFSGSNAAGLWTVVAVVGVVIGLVLLLACANVTNLLLAGAAARQGEIGVRLALGASRGRIVRQLLTESLMLGVAGGIAGWLFSVGALRALAYASGLPAPMDIAPDVRVYAFLAAVSLLTALVAGLAPARHGAHGDLVSPLKGGLGERDAARRRSPARSTLIGLQAASSIMLLVVASLFVRAALHVSHVDLGFDPSHLVSVPPAFGRGALDEAGRVAYWNEALGRVRAVAGVEAAALAEYTPFGDAFGVTTRTRNGTRFVIHTNATQAAFFQVVGLRILRGRTYTAAEVAAGAQVAVISERLARTYFGTADPIGRVFDGPSGGRSVIGVVSDAISADLFSRETAAEYVPLAASDLADAHLLIRTSLPPDGVIRPIAAAMEPLNPAVRTTPSLVRDRLNEELERPRVVAGAVSALGAVALGLALMGLYGVTAFVARQRTREIGVRLAVGATMADVVRLLVADTMRPVVVGLGCGLGLALAASRLFAAGVYGLSPHDPMAIAAAVSVLMLSACAAVIVPARQAARVDPASVLREG